MRKPEKLVIRAPTKPLHWVSATVAILGIAIWILASTDWWLYSEPDLVDTQSHDGLVPDIQALEKTLHQLRKENTALIKNIQVERQTIAHLQKGLIKHQDETYALKQELKFYQNVMASSEEMNGLSIQSLQIERLAQPSTYYCKLVLTHVAKGDKIASGRLAVLLEGVQDGVAKVINIKDLAWSEPLPLTFRFKNFKHIKGRGMLPSTLVVHRVIVRAHLDSKEEAPPVERVFNWSEVSES